MPCPWRKWHSCEHNGNRPSESTWNTRRVTHQQSRATGLHVLMASSSMYVEPTAVALKSLHESGTNVQSVRIAVSDLSNNEKKVLEHQLSSFPSGSLVAANNLREYAQIAFLGRDAYVSTARLFPTIGLSQDFRKGRVLFLDSDTLVLGSLDELATFDLDGHSVAACRDHVFPWFACPPRDMKMNWPPQGISIDTPYFNAGILLYDLEPWRSSGSEDKILEALSSRELEIVDQDALNIALVGSIKQLPGIYNSSHAVLTGVVENWAGFVDTDRNRRNPLIVHYVGWPKPWSPLASPKDPHVRQWRDFARKMGLDPKWSGFSPRGFLFRFLQAIKPRLLRLLKDR